MPLRARLRRPWSARTRGVVACAALVVVALVAGLAIRLWPSGPPVIPRPDLPKQQDAACRAFVADLPEVLADEAPVEVEGATAYGAAWGDPAIVLTCGVGAVSLADAPPCLVVNGVGWVVQEAGDETTFTADGYRPRVRVVVPDDYDQPAGELTALSPLVEQHLELEDRCL